MKLEELFEKVDLSKLESQPSVRVSSWGVSVTVTKVASCLKVCLEGPLLLASGWLATVHLYSVKVGVVDTNQLNFASEQKMLLDTLETNLQLGSRSLSELRLRFYPAK